MSTLPLLPSVLDQAALSTFKAGGSSPGTMTILVGTLLGGLAYYNMDAVIQNKGMGLGNAQWNVMSTIMGTVIGVLAFNEVLEGKQIVGVIMATAGLYLMDGK
jgi:multidrug transporter EmrE-like cation transporter